LRLDPERWEVIGPYLEQVLTLDGEERARWLARLESDDPQLAASLKTLLAEEEILQREQFLEGCAGRYSPAAGQAIGAYRLISKVGEGGMGAIWLAQRMDGRFERRAAVKFLHIALPDRAVERFRREGAILGRLVHPNIAELLDAGVSESGQPYLMLEYVEGEQIDVYCDAAKLDVDTRIVLFLDVLAAVAHAHANLVVHRDLKPSNVLVSAGGQAKLLDFGIAKLLEEDGPATVATQLTRELGAALTPYYAAPEQLTGQPVTTATDVYSLGVMLYLLLTGVHPAGRGQHAPADLIRLITDTEAAPASQVVLTDQASIANAAVRRVTPEKLRRLLRGDLDTILAKSLKKDRRERYDSATALADDLQRYLRNEPIRARPDAMAYRTAKFVRRNRVPVAAVALTIVGLAAGLAVAASERNLAAQRYGAVRAIAGELFQVDRDLGGVPGATAARERIVRTSLRYLEELSKTSGNDLALKAEIAAGYRQVADVQGVFRSTNLGHQEDARASLVKAESLFREIWRAHPQDPQPLRDLIETVDLQSRIDHASINFARWKGRLTELQNLLTSYESHARLTEADWSFLANTYDSMATASGQMSRLDQALAFALHSTQYRRLAAAKAPSVPSHGNLANSLVTYATICRKAGRLEEAVRACEEAIELHEGILADQPGHYRARVNLENILTMLGRIYGDPDGPSLGRQAEGIATLERAVEIGRSTLASDPNEKMARYNHSIAALYLGNALRSVDSDRAAQSYDEAINSARTPAGNNVAKLVLGVALAESSAVLRAMGRQSDAERRLNEAAQLANQLRAAGPTASVECDESISRVSADRAMASGGAKQAVALHRVFLAEVESVKPAPLDPQQSMGDAYIMARRYRLYAAALRAAGYAAEATRAEAQRSEIINFWTQKLPESRPVALLAAR
jgi:serine/threonine protein kinase/tetratricopeptide (TPR) repeat protein